MVIIINSLVEAKAPEEEGEQRPEKVKNAVNIISNALDKEGTRKSKSRPTMMRKPPVPFGVWFSLVLLNEFELSGKLIGERSFCFG